MLMAFGIMIIVQMVFKIVMKGVLIAEDIVLPAIQLQMPLCPAMLLIVMEDLALIHGFLIDQQQNPLLVYLQLLIILLIQTQKIL